MLSKFLGFIAGFALIYSTSFDNGIYYYIFYRTATSDLIQSYLARYFIIYLIMLGITYALYKFFQQKSREFALGIKNGAMTATLLLILIVVRLFYITRFGLPLS